MSPELPLRDPRAFHGRVETRAFESEALRGNPLGDTHIREVPVYLPPGWDAPGARFPVLFVLSGFTGRGQKYLETHPWHEGVVVKYDRAIATRGAPPCILVLPDCFTRMGGSQYVNSPAVGRYEDHVAHELVEFIDANYPTLPGRRGLIGKSSGGFGAMHLSMRHPERFPVVASISGDCHFEYCHAQEFLAAIRGLLPYDSDPARFLEAFFQEPSLSGDGHAVLNMLAMSACYSPNPASKLGFDLPVDLRTGARTEAVWERWLAFDPLVACEGFAENWKRLEFLHLEAGTTDEYHLQFALRVLTDRLRELEIPFVHEEFEGGHFGTDARYLELFPRLVNALLTGSVA